MQVVLGLMKLGKYIRYIPYPVVSGFMTAIGLIIISTQTLPVLGYYPKEDINLVTSFKPEAEAEKQLQPYLGQSWGQLAQKFEY